MLLMVIPKYLTVFAVLTGVLFLKTKVGRLSCWMFMCSTTVLGTLKSYKYAQVGPRRYTAGEPLRGMLTKKDSTRRCGSLATCVVGGKSYYFHVIEFICCEYRGRDQELAFVTWLPTPRRPTPWTTQLLHNTPPPPFNPFVFLIDIIPARLLIETDANHHYHITRIDGVDDNPNQNPNP